MTTVGDSVWRLDSATGAMSVCGQKLDHWACESVADDALALKAEVDRLARENRELKDKLAKAEEKETEADQLPANPSTQFPGLALDEMNDFINKMIRSLQDLVRDLKRQEAGQAL
jgi:predicted nucleotide-binding protein (sugar kinase/HSP70/actin superfamily)